MSKRPKDLAERLAASRARRGQGDGGDPAGDRSEPERSFNDSAAVRSQSPPRERRGVRDRLGGPVGPAVPPSDKREQGGRVDARNLLRNSRKEDSGSHRVDDAGHEDNQFSDDYGAGLIKPFFLRH